MYKKKIQREAKSLSGFLYMIETLFKSINIFTKRNYCFMCKVKDDASENLRKCLSCEQYFCQVIKTYKLGTYLLTTF